MTERMPALFLSHGAPPLVDDARWVAQLERLAAGLPRPEQILVVSAHWEAAPLTVGATDSRVPLTYDFGGFDEKYYRTRYASPGAPDLADRVAALAPDDQPVHRDETRRLDHGAYVPLTVMYPEADIPTLQVSMPTLEPEALFDLGRRLAELRDEGVLIIGSGFTTHGLPFLTDPRPDAPAPTWSQEFDAWAHERFAAGDLEGLLRFRTEAPGMPYAHPRIEHFAPLFVTLGAATDPEQPPAEPIDGFWIGLAKRSIVAA
ncbi:Extradiol ring-cleavage dioxygenase class III protein subunit B OS=Tsukamurella paurometabola (strain ATCC 8368 / DSM / CCUG 35730 / CIP 100753 / JCM 10117/ KCTC 9821 / NBRC 16120 / NCIMB 702349 / NCTC 13040) OX=521096 GN=Tpau_3264 PE=3 SV=1 [Tsukamurella paurometabola]|uniref:Extradiol ring-cleavage dioxygenase class III protein subunit B n=1 Tax=Tsukamurella paurometabola (strain ATCC 8368 / DSM 20162 / CCUG 35730 / CIP 100753 / JCM 10117 / KCTC 9821 / NBRC 16120 / NCIMB 702349 / NCTC 13040) TaxID=521096 RepID=D5UVR7_TSUPD|nr:class III extradiol ring-cleavage dioxygenase [Tsukamurella paurometabola]ADG79849.1 Extradiol ring-cleavage dioxygenase class III protein subunit B [Tsukamurella paurometabola DSM 20162]SUP37418.1 LigB family dioxygenase [Tsukamurella paurometabola]